MGIDSKIVKALVESDVEASVDKDDLVLERILGAGHVVSGPLDPSSSPATLYGWGVPH